MGAPASLKFPELIITETIQIYLRKKYSVVFKVHNQWSFQSIVSMETMYFLFFRICLSGCQNCQKMSKPIRT